MNSYMQSLAASKGVPDFLASRCPGRCDCSHIGCTVKHALRAMYPAPGPSPSLVYPTMLRDAVAGLGLDCSRQQDPAALHAKLSAALAADGKPLPWTLTLQSHIACSCGRQSKTTEQQHALRFAVPAGGSSLTTLLAEHSKAAQPAGKQTACKCSSSLQQQFLCVSQFPSVLPIHLARHVTAQAKRKGHVSFPEVLRVAATAGGSATGKWVVADTANLPSGGGAYELAAVVVHGGDSVDSGHYYAFVRIAGSDRWCRADDKCVTAAPLSDVLAAEASMLFYVLRTPAALPAPPTAPAVGEATTAHPQRCSDAPRTCRWQIMCGVSPLCLTAAAPVAPFPPTPAAGRKKPGGPSAAAIEAAGNINAMLATGRQHKRGRSAASP